MPLPSTEARQAKQAESAKGNIQKIHNSFIENVIVNNNLQALKVVFYLSTVLHELDLDNHKEELVTVTLNYEDILDFTGIKDSDVTQRLTAMQKTQIKIKNIEEKWTDYIALLPRFKRHYGKKQVEIKIFTDVAKLIINVPKKFGGTMLNVKDICKLKNKHSMRMLPLLHMINGFDNNSIKQKTYVLDELNEIFGTSYKRIIDFDRRVLKDVQKELNTTSKMAFTYEINMGYIGVAKGRPKALSITIEPKPRKSYQSELAIK